MLSITLAILIVLVQAVRSQSLAPAFTGLGVVVLCAVLAFRLGQRRAFFILPAVWLPVGFGVACLGSIVLRRPLAGLVLNGIVDGPERWWQFRSLKALYVSVTWICLVIDVVSGTLQGFLYSRNLLAWLTVVQSALPILFASVIAVSAISIHRQLRSISASQT